MKTKPILASLLLVFALLSPRPAWAQKATTAQQANPNGYFDLGIKTGSFLPYGIDGVSDLLPMVVFMMGHSLSSSLSMEYDVLAANAKGVKYYILSLSLRHDFVLGNVLPLFFLLGADGHYYKANDANREVPANTTESEFRNSTGWHLGFGTETLIYGNILFRTDVKMGFDPGRQLIVSIGGVYRF